MLKEVWRKKGRAEIKADRNEITFSRTRVNGRVLASRANLSESTNTCR